jgi:threonine aldolase
MISEKGVQNRFVYIKVNMDRIDLRSDTVTQPTPAMREAMSKADVGDDVFGEDPTINKLQEMAAERMGKEAGLFVPSGTMGNLTAVLTHCQRGDEAIMGDRGHTFLFEGGGVSALGGVLVHTLPNLPDGSLDLSQMESAIRPEDVHHPVTRLVILENTHNRCGGTILSKEYTEKVGKFVYTRKMFLHLDGARIFNAAAALGVTARDLVKPADSVTFCLSKGLCAPVGSVLCGSTDFIHKARRIRKMLGGGMRQAGVLAAAGIVALEQMVDRLADDHSHAKKLAEGLAEIPGLHLSFGMPQTNMVFAELTEKVTKTSSQVVDQLKADNILIGNVGPRNFRMVTHYWVDDQGIDKTLKAMKKAVS